MKLRNAKEVTSLEGKAFLWLMAGVSVAFAWMIAPLHGAVLWAVVAAVLFSPLFRRFRARLGDRSNLAAMATLAVIVVIIILPLTLVIGTLVAEASIVYQRIQAGELNLGAYAQRVFDTMPSWASHFLDRFGLSSLGAFKERFSAGLSETSKVVAVQAVRLGQNTFNFFLNLFVMLYLLFFFLRDGDEICRRIRGAIPLAKEDQRALFERFTVVIRATVKGNMAIALLQGSLGGLIFWILGLKPALLWGALMTILSLVPAVGSAVIWAPVAIYLLATGEVARGVVLLLFGTLVISLVDNLVRPMLVGKDTKMPDYLVLLSTLGGIAAFGINGFVIGPVVASLFISVWDIFGASRSVKPRPQSAAEG